MSKIVIRRGAETALPILNESELGFTTDTKKVFIGSNAGNVQLGNMTKSQYDINSDGVVNDSDKLAGNTSAYYLTRTNHTGTQGASTIVEDSTHRFTTDAEKTSWNSRASKAPSPIVNDILITDAAGNPIDSGKKFNDAGTTVNEILSANKVLSLITQGTTGHSTFSRVLVKKTTTQNIVKNVWTKVTFEAETIDSTNEFNLALSKFTAINAGRYLFITSLTISYSNDGDRAIRLYINGLPTDYLIQTGASYNNATDQTFQLCTTVDLSIGDYVEVYAYTSRQNRTLYPDTSSLSITRII